MSFSHVSAGAWIVFILLLGGGAGATMVRGQQAGGDGDTARAVRELTVEVRQLRAALVQSSESGLQAQLLTASLSLQQQNISAATARADLARRELETLGPRVREVADIVEQLENALATGTDPLRRRQLEIQLSEDKRRLGALAAQEQQVRQREAEAAQAADAERLRWNELVARVERLIKK